MTVIDLGTMRGRTTDEPLDTRPPPGRRSNPWLVAVAVLTLLLTGAAVPVVGPFVRLGGFHARPGDPIYMDGPTAYVVKVAETPSTVEAYDIRDGSLRWTVPYPFAGGKPNADIGMDLSHGQLTLSAYEPDEATGVVALDVATGRTRWRAGAEYGDLDARRMLVSDPARTTLSLMDRVTGAVTWSLPFIGCTIGAFDDHGTVATQCDGGRTLRLVDMATGAVRAARDLAPLIPAKWDIPEDQSSYTVGFVGGALVVRYGTENGIAWLDALRPTDLAPLWPSAVVSPNQAYFFDCDGAVCVSGPAGNIRLDAATGAPMPDWSGFEGQPDTVTQLDVLGGNGRVRPPAIVLDPHPVQPATITSGRDALFEMYDGPNRMPIFAGAYPTWVLRAVPDRRVVPGYRFATVGRLDGVLATACFTTRRYLACATAADTLTFYELPPADRPR